LSTILALQEAFDREGKKCIDKVIRNNPAMFLKMLVLLVPRELEVTHSTGLKGMTEEQIVEAIAAIERFLGERAKVIEGTPVEAVPDIQSQAPKP
jgi:hypothetical protein